MEHPQDTHAHLRYDAAEEIERRVDERTRQLVSLRVELETIYESAPVGLCLIDREMRYARINQRLADINGLPTEAHLGRTVRAVLPHLADGIEAMVGRVFATGEPILGSQLSTPANGDPDSVRTVVAHWFPLRNQDGEVTGVNCAVEEITERKRAEDALRESERKYRELVESLYEGVWLIDAGARTTFVNARMADILGYAREEMIGKHLLSFMTERAAEEAMRNLARGKPGVKASYEKEFFRKDGKPVPTRIATTPLFDESGRYKGALAAVTDITDVKKSEALLNQAIRARDDTLAIVSHDLRNPLTAVGASAELIAHLVSVGNKKHQIMRSSENIRRQVLRMDRMIGDLLDAAAIQEGRLSIQLAETSVCGVLTESALLVEAIAMESGIELTRRYPETDFPITCDRLRLSQALSNLIGNAVKFSPEGSAVRITVKDEGDHALFSVADRGQGIDPEDLTHLFDRYWQSSRRKERRKGVGLGLYIAHGIVTAHGGRIWVESRPGEGSEFFVSIPISGRP